MSLSRRRGVSSRIPATSPPAGNGFDATVLIHGDGAIGNRGIVVSNNVFNASYGDPLIRVEWVDGAEIKKNKIAAPRTPPAVRLAHARNVTVADNGKEILIVRREE